MGNIYFVVDFASQRMLLSNFTHPWAAAETLRRIIWIFGR
jgi:hypothetical protein